MHGIGFFADIRYANILQLIWPISDADTNICMHIFSPPNCRDHQVSSVVEFTYSVIMQTLITLAHQQIQA